MASLEDAVHDAFGLDFTVYTLAGGGPSWTLNPGNYVFTADTLDDAKAAAIAHMRDADDVKALGFWADLGDPVDLGYRIIAI